MVAESLRLRPGALIVFEGLDRTGKSTQVSRLQALIQQQPAPLFAHMPSGATELTRAIYEVTERESIDSPLARQLLHLACHAENIGPLTAARRERAVVLDRWWWSTIAYGWRAVRGRYAMDEAVFTGMIDAIWSHLQADLVLLFTEPHVHDGHNREHVREAYESLAEQHRALTVAVPKADPSETTALILSALRGRDLIAG